MIEFFKNSKSLKIYFAAGIFFLVAGIVSQILYQQSRNLPFNIKAFQEDIHAETAKADQLAKKIIRDSLFLNPAKISRIPNRAVYIFNKNALTYWSTNEYEFSHEIFSMENRWQFAEGENAYLLGKWFSIENDIKLLVVTPIKSNYSLENQYLSNDFASAFNLQKDIQLKKKKDSSSTPVFDKTGNYLFSISLNDNVIYNDHFGIAGFISFCLFFLCLIICYFFIGKEILIKSKRFYAIFTLALFAILLLLSYLDFPQVFFNNPLFSPWQLAVNSIISSYTHLTVILLFVFTVTLVYTSVETKSEFITGAVLLFLSVFLFYELLKSMILHAGFSFNILSLKDLDFIHAWAHLLLFVSGYVIYLQIRHWNFHQQALKTLLSVSLIYLVLSLILTFIFSSNFNYVMLTGALVLYLVSAKLLKINTENNRILLYILLMSLTTIFISLFLNENKKDIRFKILSENILINGNEENDPIAELMIEEMYKNILEDDELQHLLINNDSVNPVKNFIFDKYLKGFWNNFDVEFYRIPGASDQFRQYLNFLEFSGKRIRDTDFYTLPASLYDLSIVGIIKSQKPDSFHVAINNDMLLMEFKPKRNIRSYSFPDLLISGENESSKQNEISVARFEKEELIYHDNRYDWENKAGIIKNASEGFEKLNYQDGIFYIFTHDENKIVIKALNTPKLWAYILYILAVLMAYILIWRMIAVLKIFFTPDSRFSLGLTSKFQLVFISLLIISFIAILIFSVNYFKSNYQQEQIEQITRKKNYIRQSLQDTYFWTTNLADINEQSLNNVLTELAFRFETDINIYNTDGRLMGSSQNLIFRKKLLSKLISPQVFFKGIQSENQYEKIGSLEYLASYTELVNGDYLKIGYIAIPQYLSQTEINAKIESFLLSIIQIYLIIIILSLVTILLAGKQLAEPLQQLELKLRSMRIGGKNEKIDYQYDDEIGQLVVQYNKTVDELEKSTKLLIQSERETAWRTMARQIAHEINNPLTPMKLTLQQLQRARQMKSDGWETYFDKATQTLIEQIDNLSRIAGTFSQFAKLPESNYSTIDIASRLYSTVTLFTHNHDNIAIEYQGETKDVYVLGDAEQLIQVFNNLLKNAIQAIPSDRSGKIHVKLEVISEEVFISIVDNGTGIAEKNRDSIFKPNFTTKSTGMGLGLSITKNIIENMQGSISFTSDENAGTCFILRLKKTKKD